MVKSKQEKKNDCSASEKSGTRIGRKRQTKKQKKTGKKKPDRMIGENPSLTQFQEIAHIWPKRTDIDQKLGFFPYCVPVSFLFGTYQEIG